MKTAVYYFTSTGNSLYAARILSEHLGSGPAVPMVKAMASDKPADAERIVLVFPVYMYRAPHIVCRFIRKLRAKGAVFAVATMGGESGRVFKQINKLLKRNKMEFQAGFTVTMPDNYTPFQEAMAIEKQQGLLKEASAKIKNIAEQIKQNVRNTDKDTSFFKTYFFPGIWFWLGYILVPKLARYFMLEDTCDGCGICEKVCPVGNIVLKNKRPSWSSRCESCLACLHWCPKEAIQYGKKTAGRRRYRNLFVKASDIIAQKK